jgi:hypothetical protein
MIPKQSSLGMVVSLLHLHAARALALARPCAPTLAPCPTRVRALARSKSGFRGGGRGCSTFAASIHYPPPSLTGWYIRTAKCSLPPTTPDFDFGPARVRERRARCACAGATLRSEAPVCIHGLSQNILSQEICGFGTFRQKII